METPQEIMMRVKRAIAKWNFKKPVGHAIYLDYENEGFKFPINPETITVSGDSESKTYHINDLGEIQVPQYAKLKELSFESFFPAQRYHFATTGDFFQEPQVYIDIVEKMKEEQRPVPFVYVNGAFDINMLVTVEKFSYSETAGCDDVDFNISFKQYKPYGARKAIALIKTPSGAVVNKNVPARSKKPVNKTYTMKKGDTLSKIARSQLGNETRWKELQKLNNIKTSDLKKLKIGTVLKLPEK